MNLQAYKTKDARPDAVSANENPLSNQKLKEWEPQQPRVDRIMKQAETYFAIVEGNPINEQTMNSVQEKPPITK